MATTHTYESFRATIFEEEGDPGHDAARRRKRAREGMKKLAKPPRTKDPKGCATPSTRYQDAGKRRKLADVVAGFQKFLDKGPDDTAQRAIADRIEMIPGYYIIATDGCAAICKKLGPGELAGKRILKTPRHLCTMTPQLWRSYATVRTCRPGGGGVTWTFQADHVRHDAEDSDQNAAANTTVMFTESTIGEPVVQKLSDAYLWPLRGVEWAFGECNTESMEVTVLTAPGGELAVVIAGMRGGK